jgi:hypothetical protein
MSNIDVRDHNVSRHDEEIWAVGRSVQSDENEPLVAIGGAGRLATLVQQESMPGCGFALDGYQRSVLSVLVNNIGAGRVAIGQTRIPATLS